LLRDTLKKTAGNMKRSQTIMEYFLLLGVLTLVVIAAAMKHGGFFDKINTKLISYRDSQAGSIAAGTTP
jgi:hypothetical protein